MQGERRLRLWMMKSTRFHAMSILSNVHVVAETYIIRLAVGLQVGAWDSESNLQCMLDLQW